MGRRSGYTDSVPAQMCLFSNEICVFELKFDKISWKMQISWKCYISTVATRLEASGELAKRARNPRQGNQPKRGR